METETITIRVTPDAARVFKRVVIRKMTKCLS